MNNTVEKAADLVEAQKQAMKDVNEFFKPYVDVAKRVMVLRPYIRSENFDQEFFLDLDPDSAEDASYSFVSKEFEDHHNEYRTEYLTGPFALLDDPVVWEKKAVARLNAAKQAEIAQEKLRAEYRLKAARYQVAQIEAEVAKLGGS